MINTDWLRAATAAWPLASSPLQQAEQPGENYLPVREAPAMPQKNALDLGSSDSPAIGFEKLNADQTTEPLEKHQTT